MIKTEIIVLFFGIVFLLGCTGGNPSKGFDLDKIKTLVEDPNVELATENFSAQQMQRKLAELNPQCDNKLLATAYSVVYVSSPEVDLTLFVDPNTDEIVCTIKKEKAIDECVTDENCDDGLLSTVDSCGGVPRICSNERISICVSGDSYCPKKCTKANDSDCTRECIANSDCDDLNSMTTDSCSGLIKICLNVPIDPQSVPVIETCETDLDCVNENECSIDTCGNDNICIHSNEVNGQVCDLKKECFDGACVDNAINKIEISEIEIKSIDETTVEITWKTNKLGRSEVKYGRDITYQQSEVDSIKTLDHKIILKNLKKEQEYYYKIFSVDAVGLATAQYNAFSPFNTCKTCSEEQTCGLETGQCVLG